MGEKKTIRQAARDREPLGGPDAQALEGALQQADSECAALRAENRRLRDFGQNYVPCDRCGRDSGLDAVVSHEVWKEISLAADGAKMLCLWCMDELAPRGDMGESVSLHFSGESLISDTGSLRQQNRRLREALEMDKKDTDGIANSDRPGQHEIEHRKMRALELIAFELGEISACRCQGLSKSPRLPVPGMCTLCDKDNVSVFLWATNPKYEGHPDFTEWLCASCHPEHDPEE